MKARRRLASWLLAWLLALALSAAPAAAWAACAHQGSFVPSDAIKWDVDYAKRKITVTVSLAFYVAGGCPGAALCEVSPGTIAAITQSIKSYWSGQKYKCFEFIVNVQAKSVGDRSDVCDEAIDIGIDHSPINPRAWVTTKAPGVDAAAWSSDDPKDRLRAVHSATAPSQWPAVGPGGTFAHEFGHILGLHNNYDQTLGGYPPRPWPGQEENLMTRIEGVVTQGMVDRVVKRSGMVDDNKVLCAWTISSKGTSKEMNPVWQSTLDVDIEGMKLTEGKDGAVIGVGTIKLAGEAVAVLPGLGNCTGPVSQQMLVSASGTLISTAAGTLLRLTLWAATPAGATLTYVCTSPSGTFPFQQGAQPYSERYLQAMAEFDLPAEGGMVSVVKPPLTIGGFFEVTATGNFTVLQVKK